MQQVCILFYFILCLWIALCQLSYIYIYIYLCPVKCNWTYGHLTVRLWCCCVNRCPRLPCCLHWCVSTRVKSAVWSCTARPAWDP